MLDAADDMPYKTDVGSRCFHSLRNTYVSQLFDDLTDRPRKKILQILADGERRRFGFVYDALDHPPAERPVRDDLILLRDLGLLVSSGRGAGARWWLKENE